MRRSAVRCGAVRSASVAEKVGVCRWFAGAWAWARAWVGVGKAACRESGRVPARVVTRAREGRWSVDSPKAGVCDGCGWVSVCVSAQCSHDGIGLERLGLRQGMGHLAAP